MNKRAFSRALRLGLGSAIVELKNSENKTEYREIVQRYCLRDISYDWQAEGSKGYYLFQAISFYSEIDYFEISMIEKYLSRCENRLFYQLTEILSHLARNGSSLSKETLNKKYNYFASKKSQIINATVDEGFQWNLVATSLLSIDGLAAFKRYVTDLGKLLEESPKNKHVLYYYDWLITEAECMFGKKRTSIFLEKMYKNSAAVKALVDTLRADDQLSNQQQESFEHKQITIEKILQAANEAAIKEFEHYGAVTRLRQVFMKNASDEDILKLACAVLCEENDSAKGFLLRLFLHKPFPLGPAPLIECALSNNKVLSENAIALLEEFKDKRIHNLAIELLTTRGLNSFALGLLKKNYKKTDDDVIYRFVKKLTKVPQHVQRDIADIYCSHRSLVAYPTLLHVYQRGECSHCRERVLKAMIHCGVLPHCILEECLYDSYEGTRILAKRLIKGRVKC